MKKILYVSGLFIAISSIAGCDYDDSNDIDILKPIDSLETGTDFKQILK
ncbi:hypothetical protein [Maribacter sp. 2304DJ31-5]